MKRTCTTQQHNTHVRDIREICDAWHPWHGQAVWVHASLVKSGREVAYCSLEDVQTCRVLEVPLWMLDVAACCNTRVSKPGFASAPALRELQAVVRWSWLHADVGGPFPLLKKEAKSDRSQGDAGEFQTGGTGGGVASGVFRSLTALQRLAGGRCCPGWRTFRFWA
jgi:hypothetical protein